MVTVVELTVILIILSIKIFRCHVSATVRKLIFVRRLTILSIHYQDIAIDYYKLKPDDVNTSRKA